MRMRAGSCWHGAASATRALGTQWRALPAVPSGRAWGLGRAGAV